jgi:hypothetical protein
MPMFIYLKTPAIMLLADESLDEVMKKRLEEATGGIIQVTLKGQPALLPVKADCNITYIKEITQAEADEFHKRKEQEMAMKTGTTAGRIARPDFVIPPGIKGKG